MMGLLVWPLMLSRKRSLFRPPLPPALQNLDEVRFVPCQEPNQQPDRALRALFPKTGGASSFVLERGTGEKRSLRIGLFFSGGPASGGHNVVAGVFHMASEVIGFLDGPSGLVQNRYRILAEQEVHAVFNQGGFDLLGTGRDKIETEEQLAASLQTCLAHRLDGLVVIGGGDSNTNAAVISEYFLERRCSTCVIGVPKTIDGDLQSPDIEISFGFDSACKTYAELIGNLARDALSAKKYYHFVKLMGRSASHIALECALATHPNLVFLGEERKSLSSIVKEMADVVEQRFQAHKEYGVFLIPEGLIEFIPDIRTLIDALNRALAESSQDPVLRLQKEEKALFDHLPPSMQKQLLLERDPHGNVRVSQIDTQQLLIDLLEKELRARKFPGTFAALGHFFGYEGRSCFPTNFDAAYAYCLGRVAALAIRDRLTGMICAIRHLDQGVAHWKPKMVPIVRLMGFEERKGKKKPVIRKAEIDFRSPSFLELAAQRERWKVQDDYRFPGPIQFFGDAEITDGAPAAVRRKILAE